MSLVTGVTKDYQGEVDLDPNSLSTVALGNVELFVDSVNGDDLSPGTQARPLKTLIEAAKRMPSGKANRRIYLIGAGPYPVPASNTSGSVFLQALDQAGPTGEPVSIIGDVQVIGTSAVVAVLDPVGRSFTTAPRAPSVGAQVRFTSGAGMGVLRTIAQDDGTTIVLNYPTFFGIANPDTFNIERPLTEVTLTDFTLLRGKWGFKNIRFNSLNGMIIENGTVESMQNVEMTGAGGFAVNTSGSMRPQSIVFGFNDPNPYGFPGFPGLFVTLSSTLYLKDSTLTVNRVGALGSPLSSITMSNSVLSVVLGGVFQQLATTLMGVDSSMSIRDGGDAQLENTFGFPPAPFFRGQFKGSQPAFAGVEVARDGYFDSTLFDVYDANADAVMMRSGGKASLGDMGGSGSVGLGVNIKTGSQVNVGDAGGLTSATTVFGAGGQLQVGNLPITTYAALAGTTGQGEVDASGPTLNRFTIGS